MAHTLNGFPFWTLEYDKDAKPVDAAALDAFVNGVAAASLSDLFVFSHGWNNDRTAALDLYNRYFAEMRKIVDARAVKANIGVAGVIWPSILWPDDASASARTDVEAPKMQGGAVSLGMGPPPPVSEADLEDIRTTLKGGYRAPGQPQIIDAMIDMLHSRVGTDEALLEFQGLLGRLMASEGSAARLNPADPDSAEGTLAKLDPGQFRGLLEAFGSQTARQGAGGAAGLSDILDKCWDGAKEVLRTATYWQMKQRAVEVGRVGLGPLIMRLEARSPATCVHLIGHSFGARLVSYALSGLDEGSAGPASPVKSLLLLQGAFSHFAFADVLPQDPKRSGALKGMAARVAGPLLATYSSRDLAVGRAYPAASFANRDDASALEDQASRWGGMGSDGAQGVNAQQLPLGDIGTSYPFKSGAWINLDGNDVIVHGGLPSGAHSDIVHPHTAWVALAAAKVV